MCISTNVSLVTHDHSFYHVYPGHGDLLGKIVIGDNCFIGENAVIMYGVTLSSNIIVAAGAVVTKSFSQANIIIGGNPAKIIGTWEDFLNKNINNWFKTKEDLQNALAQKDDERFIKRKNY